MQSANSIETFLNSLVDSIRSLVGADAGVVVPAPGAQVRSFLATLPQHQVQAALIRIHEEKIEEQKKSMIRAGKAKVSNDNGWFGALIRYGARCQEIQNRIVYFQLSYTAHRAYKYKLAQGTQREHKQYIEGPNFCNPYRGPDTFKKVRVGEENTLSRVPDPELIRQGWNPAPQSNFLTESAPIVVIDEQKNIVTPPLFSYGSGIPTGLWSRNTLSHDPSFHWFRPADMIMRHVGSLQAIGDRDRCWSGRYDTDALKRTVPLTVSVPSWWSSTGAAYRDRLVRYLQIARWCVWATEHARCNSSVPLEPRWKSYCTQWGIGTIADDRRVGGFYAPMDTYADHLAMLQAPDQFWRKTHPAENLTTHLATKGTLHVPDTDVRRWIANMMIAAPSPWHDATPIMQNRRLCDIPPDAASLLPPVWVSSKTLQARIDSILSYENARTIHELQEAAQARAAAGMFIKVAIAIVVTAATFGGGAPAGGAMIGGGVAQIATACKDLMQGGVQAAVSLIQNAIETYGPALVQRLINRALQSADIGIDIPNIADCISQGLPQIGDDTLQATGARLRAAIGGITSAGYDYLGDLGGSMIDTGGRYVPDIPGFVDRIKL